jgi:hypothetical protein
MTSNVLLKNAEVLRLTINQYAIHIKDYCGLKSIFETGFKRHSEPRLPSTAQINH